MKLNYILLIFFLNFPNYSSEIKSCYLHSTERDCKYNESNNCSWISGEERCVSRDEFRYRKNLHGSVPYGNHHYPIERYPKNHKHKR